MVPHVSFPPCRDFGLQTLKVIALGANNRRVKTLIEPVHITPSPVSTVIHRVREED